MYCFNNENNIKMNDSMMDIFSLCNYCKRLGDRANAQ